MKFSEGLVFILLSFFIAYSWGQTDIRVRILSKFHPQQALITSDEKQYSMTLNANSSLDLRELSEFTIELPIQKVKRHYPGGVWLEAINDELLIVNWVDIEVYTSQVVLGEMGWVAESAMKAQAVLARSYALSKLRATRKFDVSDLAYHQVYPELSAYSVRSRHRIAATEREVLWADNRITQSVYHAECGSRIYSGYEIWGQGHASKIEHALLPQNLQGERWKKFLTFNALNEIFGESYGPFSMVKKQGVMGVKNGFEWMAIDKFRLKINRQLGWNTIASNEFDIKSGQDGLLFTGRGRGHLVGLCQQQAKILAKQGWHYSDILKFFYPNSDLIQLPI